MEELLYGRMVSKRELPDEWRPDEWETVIKEIEQFPGLVFNNDRWTCTRCGNKDKGTFYSTPCTCGNECVYCGNCLQMGLLKSCDYLYHLPEPNAFSDLEQPLLTWQGTLSKQQALASKDILHSVEYFEKRLIWAVAGAGKTEMLFEGIARAIEQKKRVCVASPRVDVVLELAPRLQQAFSKVEMVTLYGEMEVPYKYTQLVLATTHQLLRFHEAFDVLIIDEIDAFPFYGSATLNYAAKKARKKESTLLFLTATPDAALQAAVSKKDLQASILPARYHGYPLPEPVCEWAGNWRENLLKRPLLSPVLQTMKRLLANNRRFLVFIPNIKWMKAFEDKLRQIFPKTSFECVSSEDARRKEKVMAMREEAVDFLVSSTILERGVTFPDIDVLVIGAEDRIFTEASLVQIAGRAGRHPQFPTGEVIYFHYGQSLAMKRAAAHIRQMNHQAEERGLLQSQK